jgi:hypothetical protein
MERGDIVAARIKFLRTVHSLGITGGERPVFYLDETWLTRITKKKVHLVGLIEKGRLESSSRKREQAYCVPRKKTGFIPDSRWIFFHVHKCETPIIIRR